MLNIDLNTLPKKGDNIVFNHRGASFQMTVQDARIRYGEIDVKIAPLHGTGAFWVRYSTVKSVVEVTPVDAALAS